MPIVTFNEQASVKIIYHWNTAHRLARINTEYRKEICRIRKAHRFQRWFRYEIEPIIEPILLRKLQVIEHLKNKAMKAKLDFQKHIKSCEEALRPILFQRHIKFMEFLTKDILI